MAERPSVLAVVSGGAGVGVDTVRLAFEAERRVRPRRNDWTQGKDLDDVGTQAIKRFRRLPGYGIFESWDAPVGARSRMWVEASFPKRVTWDGVRGSNVVPLPLELVAGVAGDVVAELVAEGWVRDVCSVELNRVDVVRDFVGLQDVPRVIASLRGAGAAAALRMRQASWAGDRKGVSTVSWGNVSHQATLYDKGFEARLERDQLRYEYRCRRAALRRAGVVSFPELPVTLGLAKGVFDALGWGSEMVPLDVLRSRVMTGELVWRGKPVGPSVRAAVLTYLGERAAGEPSSFSRKSCWKYAYLARQLGLVGVEDEDEASAGLPAGVLGAETAHNVRCGSPAVMTGVRLDWARGTVVAA